MHKYYSVTQEVTSHGGVLVELQKVLVLKPNQTHL